MTDAYLPRVAAGDRAAMRSCIERYSGLVWSLALRFSRSRSDAEDAVQDVFLSVWQNADRYDESRASEPTFVAMVARRRLIDRMRKEKRRPGDAVGAAPFDASEVPAADDVEASAEARLAARAFAGLPAERRQVLALAVVEGMTQEEIAQETRLPLGTVKSHVRRGLAAVRATLLGERASEKPQRRSAP
jgi:RNA polymerase sigma-70 factor (ECF subfamily)